MQSSFIVESLRGSVMINEQQAEKHQVTPASSKVIQTGEDSFTAIVLSNGLSIYCGPESHLEIIDANQEMFTDFYAGSEFEDNTSSIQLKLHEGEFGFSQPEPNPTSTLGIETTYGEIEGDASSFAIFIRSRESRLSTLVGSLYFVSERGKRRFVAEDEKLNLVMAARQDTAFALTPLKATGRQISRPLAERAKRARDRVLILDTDGQVTFQSVRIPQSIDEATFNDYRLSR